nr:non-reducing end beta-l-arabinofuranosidase [Quercus suber]
MSLASHLAAMLDFAASVRALAANPSRHFDGSAMPTAFSGSPAGLLLLALQKMAYPQTSFSRVQLSPSSLIGRRRNAVSANTLLYQLNVLKKTGRYEAFKLKWHPSYNDPPEVWPIPNHLFWDSDVAKWIEGACYFLQQQKFPEVEAAVQELVSMIASAQQADGYNAGHLIEAALAHNDLYNNDMLLRPILKYVDLLCTTFGPDTNQTPGYPGHPEIELSLLRLYERTGHAKHFELARFFITERGNPTGYQGKHYFDVEAEMRREHPSQRPAFYPEQRCMWYHQAHAPIAEQSSVEGHSVRAMYLLTAVADLVRFTGCEQSLGLESALYRLWDNMIGKKMYVTGGIGAIKQWEGFGLDYFLPQGTDEGGCYSETCAAIGVMMLAERLLQIDLNSRFADVMELCLYNAVLTAMSSDGKRFTYVNQLASSDSDPSKREDWFTVACCPPNVLRLLGQIGGYVWKLRSDEAARSADIAVHLYVASVLKVSVGGQDVQVSQSGDWPLSGSIAFCVESPVPVTLRLRVPQWATSFEVRIR